MKRNSLFLMVTVIALLIFSGCRGEREIIEDPPTETVSSDKLTQTSFVSNMQEVIEKGKNAIYCSTFQLAWNNFKEYAEGDLTFEESIPETDRLNASLFKASYIDENSYVAEIGKVADGIVDKINDQLKLKFPKLNHKIKYDSPDGNKGDPIVSYAFLYKNLQFAKEFEKLENGMLFHPNSEKSVRVKGFGFDEFERKHKELRKQIDLVKLTENEIILKLLTKSDADEIILAMIDPETDLMGSYKKVAEIVDAAEPNTTSHIAYLRIPVIDFNISHSYKQFLNKNFTNPKLAGYFIVEARQDIEFKLNEKGAILKSEAVIEAVKGEVSAIPGVKFNRPFLVIMRKKGAELPYFMCWVANTELLKTK